MTRRAATFRLDGEFTRPGPKHLGGKEIWRRPGGEWHRGESPARYRGASIRIEVRHRPEDKSAAEAAAAESRETFVMQYGAAGCVVILVEDASVPDRRDIGDRE